MNKVGETLIHFGENEKIIQAFIDKGVEFVVVGGLAVSWYWPERQVDDLDLLINPSHENSERISSVLSSLRFTGFDSSSFTKPALQIPLKRTYYAELLTPLKEGPSYKEVVKDSIEAKLFEIPVRLASRASLIQMKKRAIISDPNSSEKHKKDIERLGENGV